MLTRCFVYSTVKKGHCYEAKYVMPKHQLFTCGNSTLQNFNSRHTNKFVVGSYVRYVSCEVYVDSFLKPGEWRFATRGLSRVDCAL